jgi:hypothetical protein
LACYHSKALDPWAHTENDDRGNPSRRRPGWKTKERLGAQRNAAFNITMTDILPATFAASIGGK